MPAKLQQGSFPYATYRDYISDLSATDNAYQRLSHFLATSPDLDNGLLSHKVTQVPREGSVTIIDHIGGKLGSQEFQIGLTTSEKDADNCIAALNERSDSSETRIVLLSYHRDPFTGEYTGVNTDVLDAVGKKYKVHPEVLLWHFGSDYGLDKRFFLFAKPPLPLALANRTFCQLQNDHSLFSCCIYPPNGAAKPDTGLWHR